MKISKDWLPKVKMARIIVHWSAGRNSASDVDKEHYHFIVEGNGNVVRGDNSIADNVNTADGKYAAHTRGTNTGSIGVSFAGMLGAVENPFNPGKFPITESQWAAGMDILAQLSKEYGIPVTDKTILTHAEVQANLGIAQAGKWDFTRLTFAPDLKGAKAVGDKMRNDIKARL